mmetsp:Transcript_4323/g.10389  ORF Transcript_4323/g.10389 Transcript_4323/m.10389 type:complete len:380 (+) Transcript_4323:627-1766(+)
MRDRHGLRRHILDRWLHHGLDQLCDTRQHALHHVHGGAHAPAARRRERDGHRAHLPQCSHHGLRRLHHRDRVPSEGKPDADGVKHPRGASDVLGVGRRRRDARDLRRAHTQDQLHRHGGHADDGRAGGAHVHDRAVHDHGHAHLGHHRLYHGRRDRGRGRGHHRQVDVRRHRHLQALHQDRGDECPDHRYDSDRRQQCPQHPRLWRHDLRRLPRGDQGLLRRHCNRVQPGGARDGVDALHWDDGGCRDGERSGVADGADVRHGRLRTVLLRGGVLRWGGGCGCGVQHGMLYGGRLRSDHRQLWRRQHVRQEVGLGAYPPGSEQGLQDRRRPGVERRREGVRGRDPRRLRGRRHVHHHPARGHLGRDCPRYGKVPGGAAH